MNLSGQMASHVHVRVPLATLDRVAPLVSIAPVSELNRRRLGLK